jgi:acylphosphatase
VKRLHVVIEGRVQGVGFRHSTTRKARSLKLKGWVKNRSDGKVEAAFEGDEEALSTMLDWCRKGPTFASVSNVEADWEEGVQQFDSFQVRH